MWPYPKLKKPQPLERIAFFGPMAVGKSWCADFLVNEKAYKKVAFADKLKAIAYEMYGIQSKDAANRTVLQGLGQDLRKYDSDVWIKYAFQTIQRVEDDDKYFKGIGKPKGIVVDDLRYKNEAAVLRDYGFTLILITAPERTRQDRIERLYGGLSADAYYHDSELEWLDIKPDYTIESIDYGAVYALTDVIERYQVDGTKVHKRR